MNTTFNINRLGLLLKRYFTENKQRELTFWGIATVIFMIMHQTSSVSMFIFIAGMIFAANTFKIFGYTPGGMHYLLIPATHAEKLATGIILNTFYYFGMFLITYSIGTVIGINAGNIIFGTNNPVVLRLFHAGSSMQLVGLNNNHGLLYIFKGFAIIQAIFMLGSLYFKRSAVGRTMLSIIALGIILGIIELILLKSLFGTYHLGNDMNISINLNLLSMDFNSNFMSTMNIISKIIGYLIIPFLWTVSYFRLTEKEV